MSPVEPEIIAVNAASELPSFNMNHVTVERIPAGMYRVEGRSNRDGLQQPAHPWFRSLADAIAAARRWALEQDIAAVHVLASTW